MSLTQNSQAFVVESDQFPKRLSVRLLDVRIGDGQRGIVALLNGSTQFGNFLSDNARQDDGYRFHDAFHFAYAAVLGWSPVLRSFLGLERKAAPLTGKVEDGAVAIRVEEDVAALLFSHAEKEGYWLAGDGPSEELIRTVMGMVGNFEVRERSAGEWRRAILLGFYCWNQLRQGGGGIIDVDTEEKTITFRAAPND